MPAVHHVIIFFHEFRLFCSVRTHRAIIIYIVVSIMAHDNMYTIKKIVVSNCIVG